MGFFYVMYCWTLLLWPDGCRDGSFGPSLGCLTFVIRTRGMSYSKMFILFFPVTCSDVNGPGPDPSPTPLAVWPLLPDSVYGLLARTLYLPVIHVQLFIAFISIVVQYFETKNHRLPIPPLDATACASSRLLLKPLALALFVVLLVLDFFTR